MERAVELCRETLAFLAPHVALLRSDASELDVAKFELLLGDWGPALLALPEATLWKLPLLADSDLACFRYTLPSSLHAFLHGCRRLSEHTMFAEVPPFVPAVPPASGKTPGLNPKKAHEVARLAALLAGLNDTLQAEVAVDLGAGKGHLGQAMVTAVSPAGRRLRVLAVDRMTHTVDHANKKAAAAAAASATSVLTLPIGEPAVDQQSASTAVAAATVDSAAAVDSGVGSFRVHAVAVDLHAPLSQTQIQSWLPPSWLPASSAAGAPTVPTVLVGLHACGDLSILALRSLPTSRAVAAVTVPCCYNLLRPHNAPVSHAARALHVATATLAAIHPVDAVALSGEASDAAEDIEDVLCRSCLPTATPAAAAAAAAGVTAGTAVTDTVTGVTAGVTAGAGAGAGVTAGATATSTAGTVAAPTTAGNAAETTSTAATSVVDTPDSTTFATASAGATPTVLVPPAIAPAATTQGGVWGWDARNLAGQSVHRLPLDAPRSVEKLMFRRCLALQPWWAENAAFDVGRISNAPSFAAYAETAWRRRFDTETTPFPLSPGELEACFAQFARENRPRFVAYWALRACLGPVLETLLLLDRILFIHEQGFEAHCWPLFDPALSPRAHVLLACRVGAFDEASEN